jgi:hypothetical protein
VRAAVTSVILVMMLAGCVLDGAGEQPAPIVPATSAPPTLTRDPFEWPFDANSPWNTPIGTAAKFRPTNSADTLSLLDTRIQTWVNSDEFSHPIVRSSPSDPLVRVRYENGGKAPVGAGEVELNIPSRAEPAVGADAHLHVVAPDGATAHEFYFFERTPTGATASYYVISDLKGPGIGEGGTRAYGGSAIGGLIRSWEIKEGRIGHALAVALVGEQLKQGPVWPATEEDRSAPSTYTGTIPIGSLIAIPSNVDVGAMPLSREGMILARALQEYGAYVVDQAFALTLYAEPDVPANEMDALRKDFQRIRRDLRIVSNNGPETVGGGGEPIAPPAPAFR